eukprot:TRINITY_DN6197_c0_g2_i1.p1 TRINITY_DN6197_c0_g2~~TRINITY_DN6197_c0_g2_i1.p1  ORF type:complete len:830 (+),score=226.02 TRINITY_DN6197_c0_g2_i1:85-2574(+)
MPTKVRLPRQVAGAIGWHFGGRVPRVDGVAVVDKLGKGGRRQRRLLVTTPHCLVLYAMDGTLKRVLAWDQIRETVIHGQGSAASCLFSTAREGPLLLYFIVDPNNTHAGGARALDPASQNAQKQGCSLNLRVESQPRELVILAQRLAEKGGQKNNRPEQTLQELLNERGAHELLMAHPSARRSPAPGPAQRSPSPQQPVQPSPQGAERGREAERAQQQAQQQAEQQQVQLLAQQQAQQQAELQAQQQAELEAQQERLLAEQHEQLLAEQRAWLAAEQQRQQHEQSQRQQHEQSQQQALQQAPPPSEPQQGDQQEELQRLQGEEHQMQDQLNALLLEEERQRQLLGHPEGAHALPPPDPPPREPPPEVWQSVRQDPSPAQSPSWQPLAAPADAPPGGGGGVRQADPAPAAEGSMFQLDPEALPATPPPDPLARPCAGATVPAGGTAPPPTGLRNADGQQQHEDAQAAEVVPLQRGDSDAERQDRTPDVDELRDTQVANQQQLELLKAAIGQRRSVFREFEQDHQGVARSARRDACPLSAPRQPAPPCPAAHQPAPAELFPPPPPPVAAQHEGELRAAPDPETPPPHPDTERALPPLSELSGVSRVLPLLGSPPVSYRSSRSSPPRGTPVRSLPRGESSEPQRPAAVPPAPPFRPSSPQCGALHPPPPPAPQWWWVRSDGSGTVARFRRRLLRVARHGAAGYGGWCLQLVAEAEVHGVEGGAMEAIPANVIPLAALTHCGPYQPRPADCAREAGEWEMLCTALAARGRALYVGAAVTQQAWLLVAETPGSNEAWAAWAARTVPGVQCGPFPPPLPVPVLGVAASPRRDRPG